MFFVFALILAFRVLVAGLVSDGGSTKNAVICDRETECIVLVVCVSDDADDDSFNDEDDLVDGGDNVGVDVVGAINIFNGSDVLVINDEFLVLVQAFVMGVQHVVILLL